MTRCITATAITAVLTVLAIRISAAGAEPQPKTTGNEVTQLKALQAERIEVLTQLVKFTMAQYQQGRSGIDEVLSAEDDLLAAQLDATEEPEKRIVLLEQQLEAASQLLDLAQRMWQACQKSQADVLRAKSFLLDVKIKLSREGKNRCAVASREDKPTDPEKTIGQKPEPQYEGKPLGHWVAEIKSGREERRQAAALALARIGSPTIPALTELLRDKDDTVKICPVAATALGRIGPEAKPAIPALAELLRNQDKEVRLAAAEALARIGAAKTAIPVLIELLADEDALARAAAARALGQAGREAKAAVPALGKLLADKDHNVRTAAALAVGAMGPEAKAVAPVLKELLKDEEGVVRIAAAEALGRVGEVKMAIPFLTELLQDNKPTIREHAAAALGHIGPAAVPALTTSLRHKEMCVRGIAAHALGEIGPEARPAIPVLAELLKDNRGEVREVAAEALEKIEKEKKSMPLSRTEPAVLR